MVKDECGMKKVVMKKSVISSIFIAVCIVIVVLGMTQLSAAQNSGMALWIRQGRIMPEGLSLEVQGVLENSSYCTVSLSIINVSPNSESLTKIQMKGASVLTFINGTEIVDSSQMSYGFKSGDTLQVKLIVPIANYTSNATIIVYTPDAMYYTEASAF